MKCCICTAEIPQYRLRRWVLCRTCSPECGAIQQKKTLNKAQKKYRKKQKDMRK